MNCDVHRTLEQDFTMFVVIQYLNKMFLFDTLLQSPPLR